METLQGVAGQAAGGGNDGHHCLERAATADAIRGRILEASLWPGKRPARGGRRRRWTPAPMQ